MKKLILWETLENICIEDTFLMKGTKFFMSEENRVGQKKIFLGGNYIGFISKKEFEESLIKRLIILI